MIIKPVVISDQPVPGLSGVTFGNLTWESTNNPGQTLFQSTLNGNGITTSNDKLNGSGMEVITQLSLEKEPRPLEMPWV